jgi:dTMP kinase
MTKSNGIFIVFEGLNCSGKSTQIDRLFNWVLTKESQAAIGRSIFITKQPGATPEAQEAIQSKRQYGIPLDIHDYIRDRAYHAPHLEEALHDGDLVICSRYTASTVAYQGNLDPRTIDYIRSENDRATHGLSPDLVIYLDVSPEESLERLQRRGRSGDDGFSLEQLKLIDDGYYQEYIYCKAKSQSWLLVDAERSANEIELEIQAAVIRLVQEKNCGSK